MRLNWDKVGERTFETGVSKGVLYIPDNLGVYATGVAWNGLTTVTESPSGAESNKQYADNQVYVNLISAEEFNATVEALTYPDEFAQFDGWAQPEAGVYVGQQSRRSFGLSYQTLLGNDLDGQAHGYKIHLVYGCTAAPSEKAYATVNDSPEAMGLSWDVSTTPVAWAGGNPTSQLVIDSTKVDEDALAAFEEILYGRDAVTGPPAVSALVPRLPLPDEVVTLLTAA
jgi:hypothetical protein